MKADRDCFDPARRSTLAKRSFDSVIEVFSFILPLYYFRLCFSLPLVGTNSPKASCVLPSHETLDILSVVRYIS